MPEITPDSSTGQFHSESSIKLQDQLDEIRPRESLPLAKEARAIMAEKILPTLPNEIRPYQENDSNSLGVISLYRKPTLEEVQGVQEVFAKETSRKLAGKCWWLHNERLLESWGTPPEEAKEAMTLREAHTFTVLTPDGVAGEYQVFECGSEEGKLTASEMSAIEETLKLIDQFSGGVMTGFDRSRRIITTATHIPHPKSETQNVGGYADSAGTVLNLREIRRLATENQIDVEVVLSAVLVHENLGHQLEYIGYGGTGKLFQEYFNYSEEKKPGEMFDSIHSTVIPKDSARSSSKPVREYGYVNASEDLATSTDAMVASAMDWDKILKNMDRIGSSPDSYRFEIIIRMMDDIAKKMKDQHDIGTGFVGSPITYTDNGRGLEVSPGRTLTHGKKTTEAVVREEIDKIVSPFQNLKEIIYKVVDPNDLIF